MDSQLHSFVIHGEDPDDWNRGQEISALKDLITLESQYSRHAKTS